MPWLLPLLFAVVAVMLFVAPHHRVGNNFHGRTLAANAIKILSGIHLRRPATWLQLLGIVGLLGVFYPALALALVRLDPHESRLILATGGVACIIATTWTWLVIVFSHANFMSGYPLAPSTPFAWITPAALLLCGTWLIVAAAYPPLSGGYAVGPMLNAPAVTGK